MENIRNLRINKRGTSLAVQWLGLCPSTAGGTGSSPGQRTKIWQAYRHDQKNNFFKSQL